MPTPPLIAYPAIEDHALLGNRRTAALVAADGTVDWLCVPEFDGQIVFGSLLDANRGGHWRVGPERRLTGTQSYDGDAPIVVTRWDTPEFAVHVRDVLVDGPLVVRCLECERGVVDCLSSLAPAIDFQPAAGVSGGPLAFTAWSSSAALTSGAGRIRLHAGERVWLAFGACGARLDTADAAARRFDEVSSAWRAWVPPRARGDAMLTRSAMVLRLLQDERSHAMVAAPTTSLPERIGGGWNVDYRLTWVRDTSIAMAALARLGDPLPAQRYLEWLTTLTAEGDPPLQTLYDIRGGRRPEKHERDDVDGYRLSKPVRSGNHAFKQRQLDIFGYLAECALTVLEEGADLHPAVWPLLQRSADYVAARWHLRDHGIWEVPGEQHYTSSRVMCWVALDRALTICERLGGAGDAPTWRAAADAIRGEVLEHGWSPQKRAFAQTIGGHVLDASTLLIPLYGFLPARDERVVATVERLMEELTIDGMLYRFDPLQVRDLEGTAMGEFEASFIPCTLWLAAVYRLLGREREAQAIIEVIDRSSRGTGLLAEAIDPRRNHGFAGNFPLGFSHAERIRAALVR